MTTLKKLSQFLCAIVFSLVFLNLAYGQKILMVDNALPDKYIVVLNDNTTGDITTISQNLASQYGGTVGFVYQNALKGFAIEMSEKQATNMLEDSQIKYITQDSEMHLTTTQINAPWNLDRIDQTDLPLSTTFNYTKTGSPVWVYVIDSGISYGHFEFRNGYGGVVRIQPGADFVGGNGSDCEGHGTHVSGIIAGNTYGVAKGAYIVPVRVFPCTQNSPVSTVVAGVDWVRANLFPQAGGVANLSFSGSPNQAIDDAVRNLIASGIQCVIAAGNNGQDANNYSPARVREAITVGNTNINDVRDSFSNFGTAVDLFAPGENITSAGLLNGTTAVKSGTSQAAPHVAGVIALRLENSYPLTPTPSDLQNMLTSGASKGKISNVGSGSPNNLLFSGGGYANGALNFYRYKNPSNNSNLYAAGWDELGAGKNGYFLQESEGIVATGPHYTRGPLYRYRNAATNDYIYTMNWSELGNGANGYVFEKIEGYLLWGNIGGPPLYRYWNPTISKHYYTSDFSELGNGANGYIYEGITGYFTEYPATSFPHF